MGEIGEVRMRLIAKGLNKNISLESLFENKTLKELNLEGNSLGVKAAAEIGHLINKNNIIKSINLDNNMLTNHDQSSEGVITLANGLRDNTSLLSLSLLGNIMDEKALEAF